MIFGGLSFPLKYPLGRLCEMLPYAVMGLNVSLFRVPEKRAAKWAFGILCAVIMLFTWRGSIGGLGFGYGGWMLFSFAIAFLMLLFIFENHIVRRFSERASLLQRHTLGIYGCHLLVGQILSTVLGKVGLNVKGILFCALVYIVCFVATEIISRIPIRWIKNAVD